MYILNIFFIVSKLNIFKHKYNLQLQELILYLDAKCISCTKNEYRHAVVYTVPFALIVGSITKSNGVELQKKVLQGLFCRCAIEGTIPRDREKTKARDTPNW